MIRRFLSLILVVFAVSLALAPTAAASTDPFNGIDCSGAAQASAVCKGRGNTSDPVTGSTGAINKVVTILAVFAGIAAVIVIIVAGIQYIVSGGEAAKVSEAKKTIIYALVGLVVIALARSIIVFVINKL